MKHILVLALTLATTTALAQTKHTFAGSDTLAGAITDAIIQSGMDQQLNYVGGGSGVGEKGIVNGDQGIAPMSRPFDANLVAQLQTSGNRVVGHVVALDGISMFVSKSNPLVSLDVATVARIYSCEFMKWEQIPNSGLKGDIKAFRRNDSSGTTDAFKMFTGLKKFGACVAVVAETADISEATSRDALAIGYAGLSGKVEKNREVALQAKVGAAAVLPTTATIRNFSYPFARKLYVYEITGSRNANESEQQFLSYITDRSFMDPIVQAHEFVTID